MTHTTQRWLITGIVILGGMVSVAVDVAARAGGHVVSQEANKGSNAGTGVIAFFLVIIITYLREIIDEMAKTRAEIKRQKSTPPAPSP